MWSLAGHEAIESRTLDLLEEAESEIALLVVDETLLSDAVFESLHDAVDRDVSIILGGETDAITEEMGSELPSVRVFETGLDWLSGQVTEHEVAVSRILLVDRETLLIGTYYPNDGDVSDEQAIFARGLENGIVVLLRRLVSSGLAAVKDPGK